MYVEVPPNTVPTHTCRYMMHGTHTHFLASEGFSSFCEKIKSMSAGLCQVSRCPCETKITIHTDIVKPLTDIVNITDIV